MGNFLTWTSQSMNRRAIADTREKRSQRFTEIKLRVETQNEYVRDEILSLPLLKLRDALQNDHYNCEMVLLAYAWKAMQCQNSHNCVCEFLIEAFDEAKEWDNLFYRKMGKPVLWGVPFSVKANFFDTCTFVTLLRSLGCVPFVYTNVPQTLISFVCSNPVYGTTLNPYDSKRTPGGSSGGDACLTALGGTPFGTGGDVGGSLRIPSAFCGLVTLKPTQDRFVIENAMSGIPGRGRLGLSTGYLTRSVEEQIYLLRHTYGNEDYCKMVPRNVPAPLKEPIIEEYANKILRIGYYLDDGFCKPVPACARVVRETVEKLKTEGHELIHFKLPNPDGVAETLFKCLLPEGGAYFKNLFNNDIVDPYLQQFVTLLKVPKFLRWLLSYPIKAFSPQASIMAKAYVKSAEDVRESQELADDYIKEFYSLFQELKLDALIVPAFPVPAVPNEYPSRLPSCAFSTALFNLLDIPVGVIPTGKVIKEDDEELANEQLWPTGSNFVYKLMRQAAANSIGLPLAVQIATLPYKEEQCLGVMKVVEKLWT